MTQKQNTTKNILHSAKNVSLQVSHLQNQIKNLQKLLDDRVSYLKQLQNQENLLQWANYNLLSQEADVGKINDSLKKIIDSAQVVVNKIPPQLKEQIRQQVLDIKEDVQGQSKKLQTTFSKAAQELEDGVQEKFSKVRKISKKIEKETHKVEKMAKKVVTQVSASANKKTNEVLAMSKELSSKILQDPRTKKATRAAVETVSQGGKKIEAVISQVKKEVNSRIDENKKEKTKQKKLANAQVSSAVKNWSLQYTQRAKVKADRAWLSDLHRHFCINYVPINTAQRELNLSNLSKEDFLSAILKANEFNKSFEENGQISLNVKLK